MVFHRVTVEWILSCLERERSEILPLDCHLMHLVYAQDARRTSIRRAPGA